MRTASVLASLWVAACGSGGSDDETGKANAPSSTAGSAAMPAGQSGAAVAGKSGSSEQPPPPGASDSWRMMGYDSTNTYFNPAEKTLSVANAGTLVEKWRQTVAGYPPGSPVIAEGKVFVMATGGTYAFDLMTGDPLWARMDLAGTASVAYEDGAVYVHTGASAELYKLSAADGATVWGPAKSYALASCDGTSSPIVGGGKVVVGHSCGIREVTSGYADSRGGVEAHDTATGMKAWTYWSVPEAGPEDGAMTWSSVAIDLPNSTVIATTGNNYSVAGPGSDAFHAIDLATGMKKWSKQVRANDVWSLRAALGGQDTDFGANPILAVVGGRQVVAAGDKGAAFWQLDRTGGEIDWSREALSPSHTPNNGGMLNNGAFDGQYFYGIANDPSGGKSILHKLDPTNMGADVWTQTYPKLNWGAISIANGVLFVPVNDDLYVLKAEDGSTLTMLATGGTIVAGAAAVAQGRVVVGSGLQYLFATDAVNNNQVICYGLP